jgi:hypothetical protein
MSVRQLLSRAMDELVYFETYYPNFPAEHKETSADKLQQIRERVLAAATQLTTPAQAHWLQLCDAEIVAAGAAVERADDSAVFQAIREVIDYVEKASTNFQAVPDFLIVDQTTIRPQN